MRQINKIIVHCADTPAGRDNSAEDINAWHKQRGWRCIGYHYVIRLDGTVEVGRPEKQQGAHCIGHNHDSIGVCYIGGRSKDMKRAEDTRTPEQKAALLKLLKELKAKYPNAQIYGHRDFSSKACPCFDARAEYLSISVGKK